MRAFAVSSDPSYPPELEAELAAEAEAYRELTNELGVAVRAAQGEAYGQWCEWEGMGA